ncbi:restriction endonuclease subunit S [Pseudomonas oryzihabitans]|uniref:restriction endonuclease subunit S n=1 Tax=Pseudomonas oryzihabitans TaxID=47885 RepID=UPI000697E512|nr:restriction endonuclease subunit S [Pseudomonas oryzihabitans]
MSELPNGWISTNLGQVVNYGDNESADPTEMPSDAWLLELEDIERDTGKLINQKTVGERIPKSSKNRFHKGDVLYGKLRPYLNKIIRANQPGFCSSEIIAISPGLLDKNYLFYSMRSPKFIEYVNSVSHGMRMPRLGTQQARSAPIFLPPLAEQTRIAAKLDELLAQVDTLKARIDGIPALLKRFRQSVLAAAVSGRLTEEWRAANPCAESAEQQVTKVDASKTGKLKIRKTDAAFSLDKLFAIPEGWSWVENHRLAEDSNTSICAGPFGTIFKAKDFRDTGVPIIFLRHVAEGVYKTEKPGFMDKAVWNELHQEYSVYGGELLVTKLGDPPGTACLYPQGIGTAMVTPDVIKMSVDERVTLPKYLMFFFNSQHCKALIEKLAFGATRLRIDIAMFKGFPIPLPPHEEQIEIVHRVEKLFAFADQLEARVKAAQARIDRLTQSILAKAFRGELVPQDPNDEPASMLLARIKAQRAAAPKARRGRGAAKLS